MTISDFLLLMIFLSFIGYHYVLGASCTTDPTCQRTDYTLATCTNGSCDCINSSFIPVRTGCALKLDKAVISPMSGRSNQVVNGQLFTLYCSVVDATIYEWYKDSMKIARQTAATYSSRANSTIDVGSFTCKGITEEGVLTSELSDVFKVEMLGGTGGLTSSNIQPTIVVPTTTIVSGMSLTLSCNNIPMGATEADITYKVSGNVVTNPLIIDSQNAGKDVTCTIANGPGYTLSNGFSAVGKLPTLISNIQSVTVTSGGQPITEIGISSPLRLTCTLTPEPRYLGASATITWLIDGMVISGDTGYDYIVSSGWPITTPGRKHSCTAQLGNLPEVSSGNQVTVTIRTDEYMSKVFQPIKGGRVILACGSLRNDGVTYWWYKNGFKIGRQYDRKLQIDNVDAGDDGFYECKILKNQVVIQSFSHPLAIVKAIGTPRISGNPDMRQMGDYGLECSTKSETIGMTYEWTVKGVVSPVTTMIYNLPAVLDALHNGDYTCRAKFGAYSSGASDTFTVTITDAGLFCYHDSTCIAAQAAFYGYSSKCELNDRCQCADGYHQKGNQCARDGVDKTASSLFLLIFSCVLTRFI